LIKPDLGTKRVCPSCGARFYDLQKRPVECPKCAFAFEPEVLLKQRRPRTLEPAEPKPEAQIEEEETGETGAEPEEAKKKEPATAEDADSKKSDDMDSNDADGDEDIVDDKEEDAGVGMSISDGEDDEDENDDALLEEAEDDDDDVSVIIDTNINKDEP